MKLILLTFLVVFQSQRINKSEAYVENSLKTLDGWVIQKLILTKCNEKTSIGGLKTFCLKTTATKFIKLPPHIKLKINIQLWKYQTSWRMGNGSILDNVHWKIYWVFIDRGIKLYRGPESKNCDKIFVIEFEIAHNSPIVIIILATNQLGQALGLEIQIGSHVVFTLSF